MRLYQKTLNWTYNSGASLHKSLINSSIRPENWDARATQPKERGGLLYELEPKKRSCLPQTHHTQNLVGPSLAMVKDMPS